jgi:hypothetical protein
MEAGFASGRQILNRRHAGSGAAGRWPRAPKIATQNQHFCYILAIMFEHAPKPSRAFAIATFLVKLTGLVRIDAESET